MIHPRHIAITLIVACIASAASAVANANGGVPVAKLTQTSPQGSADSETSRSKVHVEQSNAEQPRFSDTEPSSVAVEAPKPAKNPDLTSTITSGTRSSEPPLEAPRYTL